MKSTHNQETSMSQPATAETDHLLLFKHLTEVGDGAPPIEDKLLLLQMLRRNKDTGATVDRQLLEEIARLRHGLEQVQSTHEELRQLLDRCRHSPWHPATYLGLVEVDGKQAALVAQAHTRRAVAISGALNP